MRPMLLRPALVLAALLAIAGPAPGQTDSEPDADPRLGEGGRDAAVYPPDRLFDHLHMRLSVDVPDPAKPAFTARQELTLAAIGTPRSRVALRAGKGITIESIRLAGRALQFEHRAPHLTIELPEPMVPGRRFTLVTTYSAQRPGGRGAGLTWSKDDPETPETDFMFHSQGQPESNHLWFPCHDFPNERLRTEVLATVPAEYQAVSNGRLVAVTRQPGSGSGAGGPRATYHWSQQGTHPYYLVALIVGRYDVVNVGGPESARPGLWMPVYGPLGSGEALRTRFANTPEMVATFEKLFDEPYPWEKYGQIMCRDFAAGAMENTSITTFQHQLASMGGRGLLDGIIAHELVHQWFGDLVGYKSWEHLWLGEGWATFGEALWAEHQRGERAYQRAIAGNLAAERARSRGTLPKRRGMVSNRYADPDDRFMSADNVYSKGGVFLHTLRKRLGEEAFWSGVRLYLDRHKYAQVETADFRKCLEETSGQDLEKFFEQFAVRPGMPRLAVDLSWDEASGTLGVVCEQTQTINADNPAYELTLPITCTVPADTGSAPGDAAEGAGGPAPEPATRTVTVLLTLDTRRAEAAFKLPARPSKVVLDPQRTVLCDAKVRQPLAMSLEQLRTGPTLFAQLQAAETLAGEHHPRATRALLGCLGARATDPLLRRAAAAALLSSPGPRLATALLPAGRAPAVASR